jgi:hypothetical protein
LAGAEIFVQKYTGNGIPNHKDVSQMKKSPDDFSAFPSPGDSFGSTGRAFSKIATRSDPCAESMIEDVKTRD